MDGTRCIETADQLAKLLTESPFVGPKSACGISVRVVKEVVRYWTSRKHKNPWESVMGLEQAEGFIHGPSVRRTNEMLSLNRK
jgi:hypothetical protein